MFAHRCRLIWVEQGARLARSGILARLTCTFVGEVFEFVTYTAGLEASLLLRAMFNRKKLAEAKLTITIASGLCSFPFFVFGFAPLGFAPACRWLRVTNAYSARAQAKQEQQSNENCPPHRDNAEHNWIKKSKRYSATSLSQ